jgi:Ion transport protein
MLLKARLMSNDSEMATVFRILRIFRILQLEDFIVAFSKLDNVFRASKGVLKATGLMAILIWVGCGALFFIFEQNNPNWRECDASVPLRGNVSNAELGCYDFDSITDCNKYYGEGMCHQTAFTNMPDSLYYTAVFLGGEWGVVDFTAFGRLVCVFLCATGITLYAIPVGTFIDSFGAVIGLSTTS